jgi:MFS family permease
VSQLHDRDAEIDDPQLGADPPTPSPSPEVGEVLDRPIDADSTFAALRIPTYRLLWLGGVFSFLAVQMQVVARGALAYELTGSNAALGAVMFGFGVPMLLLTPVAGVAADRLSKRSVILAAQWLLVFSALFVAVALVVDVMAFWMLVASSAMQAAAFSFVGPARMAFTGEVVGRRLLSNAVVLQQMSMNGTRVFGPAIAGVLIGITWFGHAGVYFLTAGFTFIASLLSFRLPPGLPSGDREPKRPMQDFADGLRYVRAHPNLLLLLVVSLVVVVSAFPYISFLPTLSEDIFERGASGLGIMSGATAVGAVAASLFVARRSGRPDGW